MRVLLTVLFTALVHAQPNPQTPLARLEGNIQRITKSVNANWGIYIKCLETGETVELNADQQMDTMSVIKIPLMAEVFRQLEAGKFKLTDRVPYTAESMRPGTGVIRSLDPGVQLTIKDLLTLMIIVSDNTATDLLYDKVGGTEPVNQLMTAWGLPSIRATGTADTWFKALRAAGAAEKFHQEAKTPFGLSSPRDMGKLLEKLEKGEAVSKSASDQMLGIMRGQGVQFPVAALPQRLAHAPQDGRFPAVHRERCRRAGKRIAPRGDLGVHGKALRQRLHAGGGDRPGCGIGRQFFCGRAVKTGPEASPPITVIPIGYSTIEVSEPRRKPFPEYCQSVQLPNPRIGDHGADFLRTYGKRFALPGGGSARYGAQDWRLFRSRAHLESHQLRTHHDEGPGIRDLRTATLYS